MPIKIPLPEHLALIAGFAGCGKTQALRIIIEENPRSILLSLDGSLEPNRVRAVAPTTIVPDNPHELLNEGAALTALVAQEGASLVLIDDLTQILPHNGQMAGDAVRLLLDQLLALKVPSVVSFATKRFSKALKGNTLPGFTEVVPDIWLFEERNKMKCVKGASEGVTVSVPGRPW